MKYYVIMKDVENKITSLQRYDASKVKVEDIKEKILNWKQNNITPELITDETTIKVLDFVHRFDEDYDLQKKHDKLEQAIYDINQILESI